LITADLFITIQETFMKLTSLVAAWRALPWRARPEDRHHHGHVSLYADIDGQAGARILSEHHAGLRQTSAGIAVEVLSLTLEQGRRVVKAREWSIRTTCPC
jgi:hypothetical protein